MPKDYARRTGRLVAAGRLAPEVFRRATDLRAGAAFFFPTRVALAVRAGFDAAAGRRAVLFLPAERFLAAEVARRPAGRAVRVARLRAPVVDFRVEGFLAIGIGPRSGLPAAVDRES